MLLLCIYCKILIDTMWTFVLQLNYCHAIIVALYNSLIKQFKRCVGFTLHIECANTEVPKIGTSKNSTQTIQTDKEKQENRRIEKYTDNVKNKITKHIKMQLKYACAISDK